MKSFEERKAEVMLRSEIIVKKRKRRNKIILTIVPLVVCLCALSVTAIPTAFSGENLSSSESATSETSSEALSPEEPPKNGDSASSSTANTSSDISAESTPSETSSDAYTTPEEPPKNTKPTSGSTANPSYGTSSETKTSEEPTKNSESAGATSANTSSVTSSTEYKIAIEQENVTVYYVTENGIESEEIFLPCTPKDVFSAWKAKNGIGDEVELIKTEIKDNSVTESSEENGSRVITHTVGDYFILNITVSKNLESYYASQGEEQLCESLKKTMTGYNSIEFDEYYLYLE